MCIVRYTRNIQRLDVGPGVVVFFCIACEFTSIHVWLS